MIQNLDSRITQEDLKFYQEALKEAKQGLSHQGIPVGAVLVCEDVILGKGHNKRVQMGSTIRHGEMDCFENAGRKKAIVYKKSTLYTTLSPCVMCSGAILLYKIPRVIIGENINFKGEEDFLRSRGVDIIVFNDLETIQMMSAFIERCPRLWNEDIGETGKENSSA